MQYMLLVYWNEAEHKNATKEQKAETFAAYAAYTEVLKKAGAFLAGSGLQDSSAATVAPRLLSAGSRALARTPKSRHGKRRRVR